jgi:deoxyribodipyrimidine photolyase
MPCQHNTRKAAHAWFAAFEFQERCPHICCASIRDNHLPALAAAGEPVLRRAVEELRKTLRLAGSDLIVRHGRAEQQLAELCKRVGATTVLASPEARDSHIPASNG